MTVAEIWKLNVTTVPNVDLSGFKVEALDGSIGGSKVSVSERRARTQIGGPIAVDRQNETERAKQC